MVNEGKKRKQKRNKNKKEADNADDMDRVNEGSELDQPAQEDSEHEEPHEESQKRVYSDDDSDADDKPRKKKKKKPLVTETTDKKSKMSIRQMKREKFAQRQAEAKAVAKDQLKSQCLSYLSQWKHDKQNWKFMKAKQVWLYKNKFSSNLVPDPSWPLLLEYFESAKGNIRNMLLEDANKVIKKMDDWIESQNGKEQKDEDEEDETESSKPDDTSYKRARDLIQCLEE